MTPLIGNIIVSLLIAAAAAIMGRRAWRMLRGGKTGCGCDHCPAVKAGGAASAPAPGAGGTPAGSGAGPPQRGA